MSVTPFRRGGEVPACAGDPFLAWELHEHPSTYCRMRSRWLVVGSDVVDDALSMVVVGACGIHRTAIESWLSMPYGAYTVEASAGAMEAVRAAGREERLPVWIMERESAVA